MGPRVASKIPSRSPRAEGEARSPRAKGCIFDASRGPIWYFYYLIVYFMKNICINSLEISKHQKKMALKLLALKISQKIRQNDA